VAAPAPQIYPSNINIPFENNPAIAKTAGAIEGININDYNPRLAASHLTLPQLGNAAKCQNNQQQQDQNANILAKQQNLPSGSLQPISNILQSN